MICITSNYECLIRPLLYVPLCIPTQLLLILQNLSWEDVLSNQTEDTWFMLWLLT